MKSTLGKLKAEKVFHVFLTMLRGEDALTAEHLSTKQAQEIFQSSFFATLASAILT